MWDRAKNHCVQTMTFLGIKLEEDEQKKAETIGGGGKPPTQASASPVTPLREAGAAASGGGWGAPPPPPPAPADDWTHEKASSVTPLREAKAADTGAEGDAAAAAVKDGKAGKDGGGRLNMVADPNSQRSRKRALRVKVCMKIESLADVSGPVLNILSLKRDDEQKLEVATKRLRAWLTGDMSEDETLARGLTIEEAFEEAAHKHRAFEKFENQGEIMRPADYSDRGLPAKRASSAPTTCAQRAVPATFATQ